MSDAYSNPKPPEKDVTQKKMFFFLILFLTIVLILGTSVPVLTQGMIETRLNQISKVVTENLEKSGNTNASFTYDSAKIDSIYKKRAVVNNPKLSVTRTTWLGSDVITISTAKAYLMPSNAGQVFIQFPTPLKLERSNGDPIMISFNQPPAYLLEEAMIDDVKQQKHYFQLAGNQVMFTSQDSDGAKRESLLTFANNPELYFIHTPLRLTSKSVAKFEDVKMVDKTDNSVLLVEAFDMLTERKLAEKDQITFNTLIDVKQVQLDNPGKTHGPFDFHMKINGDAKTKTEGGEVPDDMDVKIEELKVAAKNYSISATGSVHQKPDDSLPYGAARITIDGYQSLKNSPNIPPHIRDAIGDMANLITGSDIAEDEEKVNFLIARPKLGGFTMGNANFEDIAKIVVSRIILGADSTKAKEDTAEGDENKASDANTDDSKPIASEDNAAKPPVKSEQEAQAEPKPKPVEEEMISVDPAPEKEPATE